MKTCSRCSACKALAEFPKAASCQDGTRSYCKTCDKARKDLWRSENKARHNAKGRAWAAANPDKRKQTVLRDRAQRYASGANLAAKQAWAEKNPQRARAAVSARRRKLRQAMPLGRPKRNSRRV